MRALARVSGRVVARVVPYALVRLGVRAWALGAAQGEPRAALRRILELHHDLYLRADHLAIAYDGGVHAKHRLTRYHDFFVERIREGERVLDVGCGKGELARDLAERAGAEVVGIDPDRAYLAFARERSAHPRVRYVEGRAPEQLPDERFDVVVLSNVLEHVERRIELLRTLVSRQRPSRVLVRVPAEDRDWLVPLRRELGLPHLSDPDHEIEYTRETLERELAEAGLTVADARAAWGELWVEARPR